MPPATKVAARLAVSPLSARAELQALRTLQWIPCVNSSLATLSAGTDFNEVKGFDEAKSNHAVGTLVAVSFKHHHEYRRWCLTYHHLQDVL